MILKIWMGFNSPSSFCFREVSICVMKNLNRIGKAAMQRLIF